MASERKALRRRSSLAERHRGFGSFSCGEAEVKLHLDFETRSRADLKKVGAAKYAADPTTEVLCFAYCIDDGPVKVCGPDEMPGDLRAALDDPEVAIVAHNAAFEMAIINEIMVPRHGW
jgi:DNA polymerase